VFEKIERESEIVPDNSENWIISVHGSKLFWKNKPLAIRLREWFKVDYFKITESRSDRVRVKKI
jgi:hypothetical protein